MATGGPADNMVMVCLKTDGGVLKVRLSEELAMIVLDPNGDPDTKQAIKDAVMKEQQIQNQEIERNTFTEPIDEQHDQGPLLMTSHDKDYESMNTTCNIPVAQTQIHIWTENEEKLLLDLRLGDDNLFNSMKNHETLWKKITEELNCKNVNVTKSQVMNKWKLLKKKYKEVVDKNGKTGNAKTDWKYYETFNAAYGNKAATQASITYDSARDEKVKSKDISKSSTKNLKKDCKPNASTNKRKAELQELTDRVEAQNDKIMGMMKKQHNAKMKRMDRFLKIFEKSVQGQSKSDNNNNNS